MEIINWRTGIDGKPDFIVIRITDRQGCLVGYHQFDRAIGWRRLNRDGLYID